jgi:hypothetical protein
MKKFLSLILATCLLATTAFMASCGSSDNSSDSGKPDPDVEFDGWTPDNILQRPVEKDDIRWQISTACAHGAKGIFWFYIYGRLLESSYRQSPFDQYYNKTATFDALARQMRLFNWFAPGQMLIVEE